MTNKHPLTDFDYLRMRQIWKMPVPKTATFSGSAPGMSSLTYLNSTRAARNYDLKGLSRPRSGKSPSYLHQPSPVRCCAAKSSKISQLRSFDFDQPTTFHLEFFPSLPAHPIFQNLFAAVPRRKVPTTPCLCLRYG